VLEALLWGAVGGASLVVGALAGLRLRGSGVPLGLLLGFGAGALISAVSFELADDALTVGGAGALSGGLAAGGLTYFAGSRALGRRHGGAPGGAGMLLVLGALLDGIPESAALGLSLAEGGSISVALLAAVFISNLPEGAGSAAGLRASGRSNGNILLLWTGVAAACAVASAVGFVALDDASDRTVAFVQAFAAGAILTMLADTMIPEAERDGHDAVGLATIFGFAVALLLSAAE